MGGDVGMLGRTESRWRAKCNENIFYNHIAYIFSFLNYFIYLHSIFCLHSRCPLPEFLTYSYPLLGIADSPLCKGYYLERVPCLSVKLHSYLPYICQDFDCLGARFDMDFVLAITLVIDSFIQLLYNVQKQFFFVFFHQLWLLNSCISLLPK